MSDERKHERKRDVVPVSELIAEVVRTGKLKLIDGASDDSAAAATSARFARILGWGVPRRAALAALSCEPNEAIFAVHSLNADRCLLLLVGEPGTGKTVAAARWFATLGPARAPGDARPLFVSAAELVVWATWSDEFRAAKRARALVIDDLGVEYADAPGSVASKLDDLIDARYGSMLPTLITTNLDATALAVRFGDRIVSRIREAGRVVTMRAKYRP
jgi:hypothetical protein